MYKRFLIVVDARPVSRSGIDEGLRLAQAHEAEVTFATVLPRYPLPVAEPAFIDPISEREFDRAAKANADKVLEAARAAAERAGVPSRSVAVAGDDPVRRLVDAATKRRCQLIVIASEGRNALLRLLTGSLVPGLITASPIPVLVCKPARRKKPGGGRAVIAKLKPRAETAAGGRRRTAAVALRRARRRRARSASRLAA